MLNSIELEMCIMIWRGESIWMERFSLSTGSEKRHTLGGLIRSGHHKHPDPQTSADQIII
jgi:hypothetical protein